MNIVIFGPPGAGKGTQSDKIIDKYNLVHLSTGDMFRHHISHDTPLGKEVKSILENGILVPDDITIQMLQEEMAKYPDANGFIFDGFPRTVAQAEALDAFLESQENPIDVVLVLDVPQEVIKERIAKRAKESQRADDTQTKLLTRIDEYFNKTIHVVPYYEDQDKTVTIDGVGDIEDIFNEITNTLDPFFSNQA